MNPTVVVFFLHNVAATFLLGMKFRSRRDPVFKDFGSALILNGVAYTIWSAAVILRPDNLKPLVTLGVLFFLASLVFFLSAGIRKTGTLKQGPVLWTGLVVALVLFLVRTYVYPSEPGFSQEGLFFFHAHPVAQLIYIFGLALTALRGIDALASKFTDPFYARLVRYGFTIQVMGGIILLTSTDTLALYIDGWIIGTVYFALWTLLLFNRKAWATVR